MTVDTRIEHGLATAKERHAAVRYLNAYAARCAASKKKAIRTVVAAALREAANTINAGEHRDNKPWSEASRRKCWIGSRGTIAFSEPCFSFDDETFIVGVAQCCSVCRGTGSPDGGASACAECGGTGWDVVAGERTIAEQAKLWDDFVTKEGTE